MMLSAERKEERAAFLRDKLQSWPGEMALTSMDISDLLALLAENAALKAMVKGHVALLEAEKYLRGRCTKAEAELDAARPLLEAARKAKLEAIYPDYATDPHGVDMGHYGTVPAVSKPYIDCEDDQPLRSEAMRYQATVAYRASKEAGGDEETERMCEWIIGCRTELLMAHYADKDVLEWVTKLADTITAIRNRVLDYHTLKAELDEHRSELKLVSNAVHDFYQGRGNVNTVLDRIHAIIVVSGMEDNARAEEGK